MKKIELCVPLPLYFVKCRRTIFLALSEKAVVTTPLLHFGFGGWSFQIHIFDGTLQLIASHKLTVHSLI